MLDVYCHTSPNGKKYVGFSSQGMAARWTKHVALSRRGSRCPLHNAIRKYGAESFTHELLERMSTAEGAKQAERLWISELRTRAPGGYNATAGGDGLVGHKASAETRRKMSLAKKGKTPANIALFLASRPVRTPAPRTKALWGSVENQSAMRLRCARNSAAQRGVPLTPEHRAALSAAGKGRPKSAEHRAKLSAAAKRRYAKKETS